MKYSVSYIYMGEISVSGYPDAKSVTMQIHGMTPAQSVVVELTHDEARALSARLNAAVEAKTQGGVK